MKKILGLTIAALLVMGLVGGGTWAYFSDVETAADNTFIAGTLNLQVGADDPATVAIDIGTDPKLKPTDEGNAADWDVINNGNIDGTLEVTFGTVVNNENTCTEPELDAGDTAVPDTGELGGICEIAIWLDFNGNGVWEDGDKYLPSDGSALVAWTIGTTVPVAAYDTIDSFDGAVWDFATDGMPTLAAGAGDMDFMVEYDFPDDHANDDRAQGDSAVFDITFTLTQS